VAKGTGIIKWWVGVWCGGWWKQEEGRQKGGEAQWSRGAEEESRGGEQRMRAEEESRG
jgi:hypothetical protein